MLHKLFGRKGSQARKHQNKARVRRRWNPLCLERLEAHLAPACYTYFDQPSYQLVVACDAESDVALLSTDASGNFLLNGQPIPDGPTVANTFVTGLFGGGGNDWLDASAVAGFAGFNVVLGEDGADTLVGCACSDYMLGEGGADLLYGGAGADTLRGEEVYGGAGDDDIRSESLGGSLFGDEDNDTVYAGAGGSHVRGGSGNDVLHGGEAGNDVLEGHDGNDTLYGNGGDDTLLGGDGHDYILGAVGNDSLLGGPRNDLMYGGQGNDYVDGEEGANWLYGEDDDDRLRAGTGGDGLDGGPGNDILDSGAGNDVLRGGDGHDTMYGGDHIDDMHGGPRNDLMYGGDGDDHLHGDDGSDWMYGENGDDELRGEHGGDALDGGRGNDLLDSGPGNDVLHGRDGHDTMYGGDHPDDMHGGEGDDALYGGHGGDHLHGEAGNDGLIGGGTHNALTGGGGADRFLWRTGDTIADRAPEDARINFVNAGGAWDDREVIWVDAGLAALVARRNDTRFLKLAGPVWVCGIGCIRIYPDLSFVRQGPNPNASADNNSLGTVNFYDGAFTSDSWTRSTTLHEIGHNWDEESGAWGLWQPFLAQSSWTRSNPHNPAFTRVERYGEIWWYRTASPFVPGGYAQTHPHEDFCETFAAYFSDLRTDPRFQGKMQVIDQLFTIV